MCKKYLSVFIALCVLILPGCAAKLEGDAKSSVILEQASVVYDEHLSENSPEYLAWVSSNTYQNMINGSLSAIDGFNALLPLAAEGSAKNMQDMADEFCQQIYATSNLFANNSDQIKGYTFSETIENEDNPEQVSIYRIQYTKNDRQHYFKQDFIRENGVWKICGDNLVDNFAIRIK